MKEIKAYVKEIFLEHVLGRLTEEGASDVAVSHVVAIGAFADDEQFRLKMFRQYWEKYSDIAKVEIVCADDEVDRFVRVLRERSYTGEQGDGRIFILNIERAINIRTGEEGERAL
jgi:nitrogen regulatory protein P-II 1